ncbi:MAG: MerR family transcriptional regulator [Clostridia bacterium]|nr:MerR family transcriptional regulator [Clostridia bacterium]
MVSMKEACQRTGLSYETLKYYCNEGLVPGVKRDAANRRVFSEHDVAWIESLTCLKSCGMGMAEMKEYLALCLEGPRTIPARKEILARKREQLLERITALQDSVAYIDWKQGFYDDVLAGRQPYRSNLLPEGWEDAAKTENTPEPGDGETLK